MQICSQCKNEFLIADADSAFYKKMNVPEPSLCPLCRRQRLLSWRNQRVLYARACDATGKPIISVFAPDAPYTVYDRDYWWSDTWDPLSYGAPFDFSKPFFEQYDALMRRVPQAAIFLSKSENTAFCNYTGECKNCYMTHASWQVEDCFHSEMLIESKDCVDSLQLQKCEGCYECVACTGCFNTRYSLYSERCIDSRFLFDCKDCVNCIGCVNLRKKNYHIFNKPFSREEYMKKVEELRLDTGAGVEALRERFEELRKNALHRFATLINCEDVTGDQCTNVKRGRWCFNINDAQDSSYVLNGGLVMRDFYEGFGIGANFERGYYCFDTGAKGMENMFCGSVLGSSFAYYCFNCHSSFEIFGCTGVRGKKYCVLNKQYTKEEYEQLKPRIISHMRETREWGEFFPIALSPFGYNETLAYDYVPLTKEEAQRQGFKWQDKAPGTYGKETIKDAGHFERASDAPDSIVKEILACAQCGKNYKIIAQELAYYKKHGISIPLECPLCRFARRCLWRNPHRLWHRSCMCVLPTHGHQGQCANEFETSYSPERPERVFCEQCYLREVI